MVVSRVVCQIVAILLIATKVNNTPAEARFLPRFEEVKSAFQPSDAQILDGNGELLHSLRADKSVRRGQWVALADISPALPLADYMAAYRQFAQSCGMERMVFTQPSTYGRDNSCLLDAITLCGGNARGIGREPRIGQQIRQSGHLA